MRVYSFISSLLLATSAAEAATSWAFGDATVSVSGKKSDSKVTERFTDKLPVASPLSLSNTDSLKVVLTAKENGKGKRPHQAFLLIGEPETGLEAPFPFEVRGDGKSKVEVSHKNLPVQLLAATGPLRASIILGSFGSATPLDAPAFEVQIRNDPNVPAPVYEKPLRYGKMPEIHHIFRDDPKNPPVVISLIFLLAILVSVPALFIIWILMGANMSHFSTAMASAPISHGLFMGSIVGIECVFLLYYTSWNLFQMLPAAGILGIITFLSGMHALGEVQSRRLAGKR